MYHRMSPYKVLKILHRVNYFRRRKAFYDYLKQNPTIEKMVIKARELGLELNIEVSD